MREEEKNNLWKMITYAWAMDKPKSNVIEPLKDASNDRRLSVYIQNYATS